jgi:hypothetical protein
MAWSETRRRAKTMLENGGVSHSLRQTLLSSGFAVETGCYCNAQFGMSYRR